MVVNLVAVLAAAVGSMIVGFLWYGPLFGKAWVKMMNFTQSKMSAAKKKGMGKAYALTFLGSLITAYVLALFLQMTNTVGITPSVIVGLWAGVGFLATTALGSMIWEGKSLNLYILNVAHHLVSLAVMGAILGHFA